jgi:hypothetical protein
MPAEALALVFSGFFAAGLSHATDPAPDMEMLEFLGRFETADGHWLDPLSLDERVAGPAKTAPQDPKSHPKAPPEEKRHD